MCQIIDEMVFGDAKRIEAQILGKLRFFNGILIHPLRGIAKIGPITGQIKTEAHRHLLTTPRSLARSSANRKANKPIRHTSENMVV